ncbi:heparinase [Burkholderiaceae bacterium 26]|nr:heparinase [Burkholderiaceae bacterium 26]
MKRHWSTIKVALALGLPNIARAVGYRAGVRLGINKVRRLHADVPTGAFFASTNLPAVDAPAVSGWRHEASWFGRWPVQVSDAPPDWFTNPLTGVRVPNPSRPWWQIPDFDSKVGDIKGIWEASRLDWVLAFAQRARQGDATELARLNAWLADWIRQNAPYVGPNWKCGQEASIRVMHLSCAAAILGQVREALPALRALIALHLERIAPTVQYAMAQDNNHGTSEAAALFIGGTWLAMFGDSNGSAWAKTGRKWLENRAARLIGKQGTFSQYSVNYHRLMLDTFSWVEVWQRLSGVPPLSAEWHERALVATHWLHVMTQSSSGDVPNVGANDGARLLPLTDAPYRDYRPSVHLAMALFGRQMAYPSSESACAMLKWLDVPEAAEPAPAPGMLQADDGGFAVMRNGSAMALLRYPRFRFRPNQADALHVDLWIAGQPCLRDAGTFSYNTESRWLSYFGGTQGHNTVQFDGRDQMPRLSRFLFGNWLRAEAVERLSGSDPVTMAAAYSDDQGASHHRSMQLHTNYLEVRDRVGGFVERAVLRWRLAPGHWTFESNEHGSEFVVCMGNGQRLRVSADVPVTRCEIVEGWESLYYLEKTAIPVLELEVAHGGTLISQYEW